MWNIRTPFEANPPSCLLSQPDPSLLPFTWVYPGICTGANHVIPNNPSSRISALNVIYLLSHSASSIPDLGPFGHPNIFFLAGRLTA